MRYKDIFPGFPTILCRVVGGMPAVFESGVGFLLDFVRVHLTLLLGLDHVDGIGSLCDEVGAILSDIVVPVDVELVRGRPEPLQNIFISFKNCGEVFLSLRIEFVKSMTSLRETAEDLSRDCAGRRYGFGVMIYAVLREL